MWWTKWQGTGISFKYFSFPQLVSFHQRSIYIFTSVLLLSGQAACLETIKRNSALTVVWKVLYRKVLSVLKWLNKIILCKCASACNELTYGDFTNRRADTSTDTKLTEMERRCFPISLVPAWLPDRAERKFSYNQVPFSLSLAPSLAFFFFFCLTKLSACKVNCFLQFPFHPSLQHPTWFQHGKKKLRTLAQKERPASSCLPEPHNH